MSAPRNDPALEKCLLGLWLAIDGCLEYLCEPLEGPDEFGPATVEADDVAGVLYMVRCCEAALAGQMHPMPPRLRRLRGGFPPAAVVAEAVCARLDGGRA